MNEVDTQETGASYSLRNVDTDMTEMQRVVEENEKQREPVAVLRAAMKQLSGRRRLTAGKYGNLRGKSRKNMKARCA